MTDLPTSRWRRAARLARGALQATSALTAGGAEQATARLVDTLGDLRGLATKVGQMASYIEGMAPTDPKLAAVFATLRAATPPSDPAAVRALVEAELGASIASRFASWDEAPVASASLGQVHRARLPDGTPVAVKVQHPGIEEAVRSDLAQADTIGAAAGLAVRALDVRALLAEVRSRLLDELDYRIEARAQSAFAAAFVDDAAVSVPTVHAGWSSQRVLTTSWVDGVELEAATSGSAALRARQASAVWRLFTEGLRRTSLLHGDPHPGNLRFVERGVIGLDFGCVQPMSPDEVRTFDGLLAAAAVGPRAVHDHLGGMLGDGPMLAPVAALWTGVLAPVSADRVHVTIAHARGVADKLRASKDPRLMLRGGGVVLPPWFLLANRTFLGVLSVLARLDVETSYRA